MCKIPNEENSENKSTQKKISRTSNRRSSVSQSGIESAHLDEDARKLVLAAREQLVKATMERELGL